jgi:hypothetical protein
LRGQRQIQHQLPPGERVCVEERRERETMAIKNRNRADARGQEATEKGAEAMLLC